MIQEFDSIEKFVSHLAKVEVGEYLALHGGLEKCAMLIEKTAKDEFGVYQAAIGPFPVWAELAESTQADRLNKGFDPDAPLLRTGGLRDSISHETDGLESVIGSTSDIMVYQEFGTSKIPPRPVLGPAWWRNQEQVKKILATATVVGLLGGGASIPLGLGYDREIV